MRRKIGVSALLGGCVLYFGYHSHHVFSEDGNGLLPALTVLMLWVPVAFGTVRWLGLGLAARLLGALAMAGLTLESVGVLTGLPYGDFSYSNGLAPKILGITPWTVGLVWPVLVLGAFTVASRIQRWPAVLAISIAIFVTFDLVIDPGAVALGLWSWSTPGAYFGTPLSNYLGWALGGAIGALVVVVVLGPDRSRLREIPRELSLGALLHVLFFAAVCFAHDRFEPGLLGLSIVVASGLVMRPFGAPAQVATALEPGDNWRE